MNSVIPFDLVAIEVDGPLAHMRWELPISSGYTTELHVANNSAGPFTLSKELPQDVKSVFLNGSSTIFVKARSVKTADGSFSDFSNVVKLRLSDETADSIEEKIADIHDTIGSTQKKAEFSFWQADGLLEAGAASVDFDQLANVTDDTVYIPLLSKTFDTSEIGERTIEKLEFDLVVLGFGEEGCSWAWEIGEGSAPTVWTPITTLMTNTPVVPAGGTGTAPIDSEYEELSIKGIRSFDEAKAFPFTIRLVAKLNATMTIPMYTRITSSSLVTATYGVK